MNTDLTDAEWALVADLFERDGRPGTPPRYERRLMVNACCYALRTGCAWRLLPKSFPPWQAVYKSFSRWAVAGVFETRLARHAAAPVARRRTQGLRGPSQAMVVERTHAWNERARRLIAHHDRSDWAPVAWVWLAEARILATRLAT